MLRLRTHFILKKLLFNYYSYIVSYLLHLNQIQIESLEELLAY